FIKSENISDFLCLCYGELIATIKIPDDSMVYIEGYGKYKANKLFIESIDKPIGFMKRSRENCITMLNIDAFNFLKEVEEQDEELCKIAVRQCGMALVYVKNQTEEICKIAVKRDGTVLKYVKNQTDEICKLA